MRAWCIVVLALAAGGLAIQGCGDPWHRPDGGEDAGEDGGQDSGCPDPDGVTAWTSAPATLSATGYGGEGMRPFHPTYELWSDGAQKRRWVKLPACGAIDTADMDHWQVPVGTRFWKEFVVNGRKVETRLIARVAAQGTASDFIFAPYQWDDAGTEAYYVPDGGQNVNGTPHDIPSVAQCSRCHGSLPEHVLGFGAIQLSHGGGSASELTLDQLAAEGRLTAAPADGGYPAPGDPLTARALGYLHANCGHCHHADGVVFTSPFLLRLLVGQRTPEETSTYRTAVGKSVERYYRPGIDGRIVPDKPDASCVSVRMSLRVQGEQMPPLATEQVDSTGLGTINDWINSLPPKP